MSLNFHTDHIKTQILLHSINIRTPNISLISLSPSKDNSISANDALAYLLMKKYNLKEAYSFDKHFDILKDVTRLPKV